jgi:hypothetical protein
MRVHHAEHLLTRQPERDELVVFLGDWRAEGTSYGGTDQSGSDPCANGVPWTSTRTGRWHTGRFFLILDERACPGGAEFDTLSMGADASTGGYFVRSFEESRFLPALQRLARRCPLVAHRRARVGHRGVQ